VKTGIVIRIVLILLILIAGGFIFGFSGKESEWGSFQVMGVVLFAVFFPWEWILVGIKDRNKEK
jgi:hypothetical protein